MTSQLRQHWIVKSQYKKKFTKVLKKWIFSTSRAINNENMFKFSKDMSKIS